VVDGEHGIDPGGQVEGKHSLEDVGLVTDADDGDDAHAEGRRYQGRRSAPLLVLGTTPFSEQVAATAAEAGFRLGGFVENLDPRRCRRPLGGLPVYWIEEIEALASRFQAVCGLGSVRRRAFIAQVERLGIPFATVVHPRAVVSRKALLGPGCYVGARALLAAESVVEEHALVLMGALVGCRARVGACSSVLMGAKVGPGSALGPGVYVGSRAAIGEGLRLGAGAVVGAGATVLADVPERALAVGAPARIAARGVDPP
jgi:sugar O-acyltransferase (sialic acid O-acetyltransferase NeuD family)